MADGLKATVTKQILEPIAPYIELARLHINERCNGLEAWQIIFYTFGITMILVWLHGQLFKQVSLKVRVKKKFFRFVRSLPIVKEKIAAEINKISKDCEDQMHKDVPGYVKQIPKVGLAEKELFDEIDTYRSLATVDWQNGRVSGAIYSGDASLARIMTKVLGIFAFSNPLHPDIFPDVRKMEAELIRMCCTMFHGNEASCGTTTSGGTESIMLACKAYRDMARDRGIEYPEMVVPKSAHAAFDKAAEYFGIKLVHVDLCPKTMQVNMKAMKRAITSNTCMLVGSAPQFPHGIIDPIQDIAKLGKSYNIPVHVDACLGGFLIAFMKKAGFELQPFDFAVDGVCSISCDTHKYGFSPKGTSVILYSEKKYRDWQFFVAPDWLGGIYATATFAGSRSGQVIAATWATLMYIGEEGYVTQTKKIITTTRYMIEKLRLINGIYVIGEPEVSVIGVASLDFNIYRLYDALTAKGWHLNALQFPSSFHLCVTKLHTHSGVADSFVADVEECTAEIMKTPNAKCGGMGAIYGMAQSIPDRSMVSEIAQGYLNAVYSTGDSSIPNGKKMH
ncbi:sphingosine-1-phosphate lyase 1-like [Tubulanus polymorphus]|uniref:sphingosine-1-phosphate lyase 1-like n=1 Tax=Tubulanus polymorphus TaxID=672921 RepID=UPI003DA55E88